MARLGRAQPFKFKFPIWRFFNTNYIISFTDDVATLSDTIVKSASKFLADIATLSDEAIDTVSGKGREFIETITTSEVFRRAMTRIHLDTATLSEVFAKAYGRFVAFLDAFSGLTDTFTWLQAKVRTFTETATLSEIFSRVSGLSRLFSETVTLSEVFSRAKGYFRTLTDTFSGFTDTIKKATTRSLSDLFTLSDTIRKYLNGLIISIWTKVAKQTTTWTKTAKTAVTGIWTKVGKPY